MIRIIGRETRNLASEREIEIGEIARQYGLTQERYVAVLNGKPATWDRIAGKDDDLVFLEVFSGG
ncbi:MAG: hypothetical protein M1605_03655 [Candidatus Thermoplasmatota archaeon]|nr:hypothetical protein [Candidatus Thermoplasmatota archaeon]